jgi:hypothetical protein
MLRTSRAWGIEQESRRQRAGGSRHEQTAEKLNILSTSIRSVIPEGAKSACGGESRKKILYWIPDLDFVSSGMTFGAVCRLFQQPARHQILRGREVVRTA